MVFLFFWKACFFAILNDVFALNTRGKWHSIFRSDANHFSNDPEFLKGHLSYFESIKSSVYAHKDREHAFIVKLRDTCTGTCHNDILKTLPSERYNIVNAKYGQIFTHASNMEALATTTSIIESYVPMLPELKIEKDLGKLMKNCQPSPDKSKISVHVAIGATSETLLLDLKEAVNAMSNAGIPSLQADLSGLEADKSGMMTVSCTCEDLSSAVAMLSQRPEIVWIEHRLDVVTHNRWGKGLSQSGVYISTPLYNANLTGQGHIIGIADTGLDMHSCYFYDPLVAVPYDIINNAHRKVVSYISTYGNKYEESGDPHGTHVCGTAAGNPHLNYGDFHKYSGAAYNSKIAFMDISNRSDGFLKLPTDLYNQMFKLKYKAGAKIISNSWGSTGSAANVYTTDAKRVDSFMYDHPESLIIFSAGNSGTDGVNTVGSPSTNKNGMAIGASLNDRESWLAYSGESVSAVFNTDAVAEFSSKGPTADGRRKPDVVAPGFWITSAAGYLNSKTNQCELRGLSGTSMSAPLTAANAVLIRQFFLDGFYPSGKANIKNRFIPSGALIKAMLIHSGQSMKTIVTDTGVSRIMPSSYPNNIQGYGRIQVNKILNFGKSSKNPLSLFVIGEAYNNTKNYRALEEDEVHTYYVIIASGAETLKVTLAYTDITNAAGSTSVLVNNLDLSIIDDSFKPYYSYSSIDNVEQIIINNPKVNANYTIQVIGKFITTPNQPYALVVTGKFTISNMTTSQTYSNLPVTKTSKISSENVAVIGVLSAVCFLLLILVICVRYSNQETKEVDKYVVNQHAH